MKQLMFDPCDLKSNDELLAYLDYLHDALCANNQDELADRINFSKRFASGSTSEFLHEVGCALKEVKSRGRFLSLVQVEEVSRVIAQIDEAFRAIGGA